MKYGIHLLVLILFSKLKINTPSPVYMPSAGRVITLCSLFNIHFVAGCSALVKHRCVAPFNGVATIKLFTLYS